MADPAPNFWCIIHGTPGKDPLTVEGPFWTQEQAQTNLEDDQKTHPDVPVMVDVLINPLNC